MYVEALRPPGDPSDPCVKFLMQCTCEKCGTELGSCTTPRDATKRIVQTLFLKLWMCFGMSVRLGPPPQHIVSVNRHCKVCWPKADHLPEDKNRLLLFAPNKIQQRFPLCVFVSTKTTKDAFSGLSTLRTPWWNCYRTATASALLWSRRNVTGGAFQSDTNLANHRHRTRLLADCQWRCRWRCGLGRLRNTRSLTKTIPRDRRKLIKLMLRKWTFLPPRSHLICQFVKRHLVTLRREQYVLAQWLRQYFCQDHGVRSVWAEQKLRM